MISAGTLRRGAIVANNLENLRAIVDERLWGVVYAVRAAAPKMEGGSITLFSGTITSRPHPIGAMSTIALSAIEAMAHALAVELAPIRVNTITPGLVDTPLQGAPSPERDARLAAQAEKIPARHVGTGEDIAQVVLMLMTNRYITGEVIHVDGGGRYV